MSRLIARFCDIDDFCKWFAPLYTHRLPQRGQRQRTRQTALGLSELMTLLVSCHARHYRAFQHYCTDYGEGPLRPSFPALVSSSRFVALMPRALVPLCGYLSTRKGRCTGLTFVDSTSLAVGHHRRIGQHKGFAGYATRGQASMGWFFGCKLHLMSTDEGELVAFWVTTGEVQEREPVQAMARELWGHLYGDRGDISKVRQAALLPQGLKLITVIRRTMTPRLMRLWDRLMLRKRVLSATVNAQLKNVSRMEHSRHRSVTGWRVHLVAGLSAYTLQPQKPSRGLRCTVAGLPVAIEAYPELRLR